jgi:hypothetical protein
VEIVQRVTLTTCAGRWMFPVWESARVGHAKRFAARELRLTGGICVAARAYATPAPRARMRSRNPRNPRDLSNSGGVGRLPLAARENVTNRNLAPRRPVRRIGSTAAGALNDSHRLAHRVGRSGGAAIQPAAWAIPSTWSTNATLPTFVS